MTNKNRAHKTEVLSISDVMSVCGVPEVREVLRVLGRDFDEEGGIVDGIP